MRKSDVLQEQEQEQEQEQQQQQQPQPQQQQQQQQEQALTCDKKMCYKLRCTIIAFV